MMATGFPRRDGPPIEPLNPNNYRLWSYSMKMGLMECALWGYVTGTKVKPDEKVATPKEIDDYQTKMDQTRGFVCLYVSDDLKHIVKDLEDAKTIWDTLKSIFEPTTRARKAELRDKFYKIAIEPNVEWPSIYPELTR